MTSTTTISDVEIQTLVAEAEEQLSEYMELAALASEGARSAPSAVTPTYSWDNPVGLVISDQNNNGLMVSAPSSI